MRPQTQIKKRWLLGGILAIYIALAVVTNVTTPLFEAPDEADHYRFARWLSSGQAYPDLTQDALAAGHEIWQMPLYYYLISPLVRWAGGGDPHDIAPLNPGYWPGYTRLVHVHSAAESFPYAGTALAVHLARLVTTLFGCGVVMSTYSLSRIVWPRAALVAAALVAFNPQFVFMGSVISNDVPAACLAGLTVWWLFRGLSRHSQSTKWAVGVGLLWGLAILVKLNNVALAVPIGAGWVLAHRSLRQSWRAGLINSLIVASLVALMTGWWFVLNQVRYQDWLAWRPMLDMVAGLVRAQPLSWDTALTYSTGLLRSFWLLIGYGFRGPDWFYWIFNAILLAAIVGLAGWVWRHIRQRKTRQLWYIAIMSAWIIVAFISLLQWMRILTATDQGRLLFPVISGLGLLMAIGLTQLTWRRLSLALPAVAGLLICAVLTPFTVIAPAYAHPATLPVNVEIPTPRTVKFADEIALRGYPLLPDRLDTPGALTVELYWSALSSPSSDYIVRLTLVDADGKTPASLSAMPFEGRYPTTSWALNQVWHDRYLIAVPAQSQARVVTVYLSLYPIGKGRDLVEAVEHDESLGTHVELGTVKLRAAQPAVYQPPTTIDAAFGDEIRLTGFDAPATLASASQVSLGLYWQGLRIPQDAYTVFVHLIGPDGQLVTQADSPPQAGRYPTNAWDSAEQVEDKHDLILPDNLLPGEYQLMVGLYRPSDGQRLPVRRADGTEWANSAVVLRRYVIP